MNFAHLLEAGMLVCFGFSWPLNVIKAYKARTAKGTSLAFIILIITGYVAGISAKIINKQFNYVLAVYFLNLAIVMTNIFVYIRNKALDKKSSEKVSTKIEIKKLYKANLENAKEDEMLNYSNSLDELINKKETLEENQNAVLLVGGSKDCEIPVAQLAKDFNFNFDIYNKSCKGLSLENAREYFTNKLSAMNPEGILLHIGEEDISLFKNDSEVFDNYYLELIDSIREINKNCRIALVSINNSSKDKLISLVNAHIKAIAETQDATYINLENAKLWNPEATKASVDFAYSMGLRIRKPLKDVAEILYSYAFHNLADMEKETLVS